MHRCGTSRRRRTPPPTFAWSTSATKSTSELTALDKAKEEAMNTYIKARDAYEDKRKNIESNHQAVASNSCEFERDVEWKGQYLIVDEFSHSEWCNNNIILTGPANSYITTQ